MLCFNSQWCLLLLIFFNSLECLFKTTRGSNVFNNIYINKQGTAAFQVRNTITSVN